jgi:hypothetical protein
MNATSSSGGAARANRASSLIGQRVAFSDLRDQSPLIAPVQAAEGQHRHLRLAGLGRLELGTERHDQQHGQIADALDGEVEQFARGRIDPMRVLEDHQHRLSSCEAFELPDQRLECPLLAAARKSDGTMRPGRSRIKVRTRPGRVRSLQQLADRDGITGRYIRRLLNLAFLSPELVEAILQGRQPIQLTATCLTAFDLPLDWTEQHRLLSS